MKEVVVHSLVTQEIIYQHEEVERVMVRREMAEKRKFLSFFLFQHFLFYIP